jgi:hypothetical protein
MKKSLALAALAFFGLAAFATEADAYVCARGPYRAGCAGPRGAVVARRPYYRPHYYHPYYRGPVVVHRRYW